ncbi:uncharacterized protein N7487_002118 [Penicillium crustosum]|uniref:uncharacterized protein n=1 Tax=Penicillium crustosum TaxID=36656 RepID=UPI002398074C|nr:uncharacterized protein N7487_002118 [Penicillium crustosum]KAJ5418568.1 hypothetical protein N7487_002118 [Penicillium crustosum]
MYRKSGPAYPLTRLVYVSVRWLGIGCKCPSRYIRGDCKSDNLRLSYTALSTVFSGELRDCDIRISKEPDKNYWKNKFQELGLPRTHRIFTIVALISGREGDMLRVLLCSWRFENNCLYREDIFRMRSSLGEQVTRNDWLKISLASQGDVNCTRFDHLKNKQSFASTSSPPRLWLTGPIRLFPFALDREHPSN